MRRALLGVLLCSCALAQAAPPPAPVQAEIDALISRLQASGCEFQRNGRWHAGAEAVAHLQKKRDYLEGRDAIRSAEDFVNLAASESSLSGEPYRVRCAGAEPVDSRAWLQQRLQELRRKKP
ncbi:DUF5329 domain-containing protein [Pseudorhodoferax sp. Leaf274]|uniref:DUF5329 domain-containing protein n=1 Tax=Pseudorhodoferax sp. Leaf274 TaxID=1736318 RepID=UPI00070375A8|nr:DUF5329 domain-containing protein [Pseudorhodoferax sp. Leaf274]KQP50153.1 hypothetical protein ASF44_05540 [Pseudorhodoferax sp. Leaf274]